MKPDLATLLDPAPTRLMAIINVTPDSFSTPNASSIPTPNDTPTLAAESTPNDQTSQIQTISDRSSPSTPVVSCFLGETGVQLDSFSQPIPHAPGFVNLHTSAPTNVRPKEADSHGKDRDLIIRHAIDQGINLAEQGAQIIDIGGESTRPGATRTTEAEEFARVIPVVAALANIGLPVSIDTVRSRVAQAAVDAGAILINDVSGGLADPTILTVAAQAGVPIVLQHWRTPFDHKPTHTNILSEVPAELATRVKAAREAGIPSDHIILDPGIGFAKTNADNWELVSNPHVITELGFRTLWGVSRKRFLAEAYDHPTEPWERDTATVALTTHLGSHRAWAVRVHTITDQKAAVQVANFISGSSSHHPQSTQEVLLLRSEGVSQDMSPDTTTGVHL
ncbi:MAG: dihydropteroate synthase [Propionibacteriaceae bacterium]|jgi:dihydropteroate synthase|nr:dihydropteroate synthase [Propionibacteriaceae bacterium]